MSILFLLIQKSYKYLMKLFFKTIEEMLMAIAYNIMGKKSILGGCDFNLQGSLYRVDFKCQIP